MLAENDVEEKALYQTAPEMLRPVDLESRLIWCDERLQQRGVRLMVELQPEQLERLRKVQKEQEDELDQSSSSESGDDVSCKEFREEIEVGEKEIYVLQKDYAGELKRLAEETNVKVVLTASKVKLFSDTEKNIDDGMRLITNLTQKICVQIIQKNGRELHGSRIYAQKLREIKVMEWKKQYYYYFDKQLIKVDEARRLMEEISGVEHYSMYLVKDIRDLGEYRRFVRMMYSQYASQHLLKLDNKAEREELQSEISNSGRAVILHGKNLNFLREKADKYFTSLNGETLLFILKLKPSLSTEERDALISSAAAAKKYITQGFDGTTDYTLVGFMIKKENLKNILKNDKFRGLFGRIFKAASKISEDEDDELRLLFFIPYEGNDRKRKYIENKMQGWQLNWLNTQLVECTPKIMDWDGEVSKAYLEALDILINYKPPQEVSFSAAQLNTSESLNNTSIIGETINETTFLNNSVLDTTARIAQNVDTTKRGAYKVWLDQKPVYAPMEGDNKLYELGKKDRVDLPKRLEELTNENFSVYPLVLNQKLQDEPHEQPPGVRFTLVMHKNSLNKTGDCQLMKLRPGITFSEGFLVEAAVAGLGAQYERYFVAPNASIFRPTHYIEKI